VAASLVRLARILLKAGILFRAVLTCDAFIFVGGETFFRRLDPRLLRVLRKRVIVVFLGSDHRPPYLNGRWVRGMPDRIGQSQLEAIRLVRDRVRSAECYADVIVANGASAQFHTRPFVQIIAMGIPGSFSHHDSEGASGGLFTGAGVRVLHAPSDPVSKGTDLIRAAVDALKAQGFEIDYVELMGRPHADVVAGLRECDLVVDEVYSDAPMAMFSAEAAYFDKPALVTGYYARLAPSELRDDVIPPSLFCPPDQLQASLERLVADEGYRLDLGRRAGVYVRARWGSAQVAERYLRIVNREIQTDWMVDPSACRYLQGWGMPDDLRRRAIGAIVRQAGTGALCLTDRPDLEARLVESARG
jgi:hypothetical protein